MGSFWPSQNNDLISFSASISISSFTCIILTISILFMFFIKRIWISFYFIFFFKYSLNSNSYYSVGYWYANETSFPIPFNISFSSSYYFLLFFSLGMIMDVFSLLFPFTKSRACFVFFAEIFEECSAINFIHSYLSSSFSRCFSYPSNDLLNLLIYDF